MRDRLISDTQYLLFQLTTSLSKLSLPNEILSLSTEKRVLGRSTGLRHVLRAGGQGLYQHIVHTQQKPQFLKCSIISKTRGYLSGNSSCCEGARMNAL